MTSRRDVARVAFPLVAAGWAIAAHWPRLEVGGPGLPYVDTLAHAGAFALWTALLGLTGWSGPWPESRRRLTLIAVSYAVLDEAAQAIPSLGRHAGLGDFFADLAGVALGLAALGVMGQPGTGHVR